MKRIIVVLLLITILAILITTTLIFLSKTSSIKKYNISYSQETNNSNISKKNVLLYKNYHENLNDDIKGVELDEIFYENPISFEKCIYEEDDIKGEYYQISGLKDKNIEKSINDQLKESFINFVNDNKQYIIDELVESRNAGFLNEYFGNNDSYILRQEVLSNFGNIISCANYFNSNPSYFTQNFTTWGQNEERYINTNHEFININLNNGKELKFEELFTSDADLLRLISNAYHNTIRGEFYTYNWDHEEDPTLPVLIDNSDEISPESAELEIENIIKIFKNNEHTNFGFTPARLFLVINGRNAEISLKDNRKYVAIYKRFVNEDIFLNKKSSNPVRVFLDVTYDNSLLYSYIDDNNEYYIYDREKSGQIKNKNLVIEYVNELIKKYKDDLGNKEGVLFVQVYNLDSSNVVNKYKDKINSNMELYIIPNLKITEYEYQDAFKQCGSFDFGYVDYYSNIDTIFGIQDGKIVQKEDLYKYLFNTDGDYKLDVMLEADGRILTLRLSDSNNEDLYYDSEVICCAIARALQYTNIKNFTGVT